MSDGVSLEQHAGVTAARAEGIALRDVLGQEQISEDAWRAADATWKRRLAGEPAIFARWAERLAEAEDCLARRVRPLDESLAAWCRFQSALTVGGAAAALIEGAGLGPNDLARLARTWRARLDADAKLRKEAADLAREGAAPVPSVEVEPVALRRFPWSPEPAAPAVPAPPPIEEPLPSIVGPYALGRAALRKDEPRAEASPIEAATERAVESVPELGLHELVVLCVEPSLFPARRAAVLARFGIAGEAGYRAVVRAYDRRLALDPALRERWIQLSAQLAVAMLAGA